MGQPTFSEVIKLKDGIFHNLSLHIERMNRTCLHFYNQTIRPESFIQNIPADSREGLIKCRVVYSDKVEQVTFTPYAFKEIKTVAIVHDDTIDYSYKSTDRSKLNRLLEESGCDEIILIKDGFVTDSSAANLVLKDSSGLYTPGTYLLPGTKREHLLQKGIITERVVQAEALANVDCIYLINAMIDLEDKIIINPNQLKL